MILTTETILATFIALVAFYYPELSNPKLLMKETKLDQIEEAYDFIIVGAGSAGSVLASRLSEIQDWKILLLESGGDETPLSKVPLFVKVYRNYSIFWKHKTVKQENACLEHDGVCDYPSGRVMGGSSSVNGMLYARGSKHDFNDWEELGCQQWSYDNVLPYFKKSEANQIPNLKSSPYHGKTGPLIVQHTKYQSHIAPSIIQAAQEIGIPHRDYNGEFLTGADIPQVTICGAQRWSASMAYLQPAKNRSNLHILKHATVRKITINNKLADGIEFEKDGIIHKIRAKNEVIVSAGAVNSPKLLMLSGVGPKDDLEKLGISVVADRPVGQNLQDHALVKLTFKLKGNVTVGRGKYSSLQEMLDYTVKKNGLYTYNGFAAMIFFSTGPEIFKDPPDIQIHVNDYSDSEYQGYSLVTMFVNKANPESRGTIKLRSSDPSQPPIIDPKYFTAEKDIDDTIKGLVTAIKIMKSSKMSQYKAEIAHDMHPHCNISKELKSYLTCVIKHYSGTVYHPVGTVRMGSLDDARSVVDSELRVIGINHLRVVDASIMPKIVRANTNGPVMMLAEKASDIIKQYYNRC